MQIIPLIKALYESTYMDPTDHTNWLMQPLAFSQTLFFARFAFDTQTGDFYLKVPHILYLFVRLALLAYLRPALAVSSQNQINLETKINNAKDQFW